MKKPTSLLEKRKIWCRCLSIYIRESVVGWMDSGRGRGVEIDRNYHQCPVHSISNLGCKVCKFKYMPVKNVLLMNNHYCMANNNNIIVFESGDKACILTGREMKKTSENCNFLYQRFAWLLLLGWCKDIWHPAQCSKWASPKCINIQTICGTLTGFDRVFTTEVIFKLPPTFNRSKIEIEKCQLNFIARST